MWLLAFCFAGYHFGAFVFWKRSLPDTVPRVVELLVTLMLFLSASINPFIYISTIHTFRGEFNKLLCWWKETRIAPEVTDSVARKKEVGNGEEKPQQREMNV